MKFIHIIWMFVIFSPVILVEKIDEISSSTIKLFLYKKEQAIVDRCEKMYFPKTRHSSAGYRYSIVAKNNEGYLILGPYKESKKDCEVTISKNINILVHPTNPKEGYIFTYRGFYEDFIFGALGLVCAIFSLIYIVLHYSKKK